MGSHMFLLLYLHFYIGATIYWLLVNWNVLWRMCLCIKNDMIHLCMHWNIKSAGLSGDIAKWCRSSTSSILLTSYARKRPVNRFSSYTVMLYANTFQLTKAIPTWFSISLVGHHGRQWYVNSAQHKITAGRGRIWARKIVLHIECEFEQWVSGFHPLVLWIKHGLCYIVSHGSTHTNCELH